MMWCESNFDPYCNLGIWDLLYSGCRATVPQFLHHFGESHYSLVCNCMRRCLLSVPDDLVHGFRLVTNNRDVAICII